MKPKELDNTFLLTDPMTGRRVSEACFNNTHDNTIMSLCRAVACKCVCHDPKPKRIRRKHEEATAPPITADKVGAA